jgi:hypothetical protein
VAKRPPIVKPSAPKEIVRNRKPAGPARVVEVSSTGMRCEGGGDGESRCTHGATVFNRWKWWCRKHDPGSKADPACSHSQPSHIFGRIMCSYCGGDVKEASDETA